MRDPRLDGDRHLRLADAATDEDALTPSLERAAQRLRVDVPVARDWRAQVLREVARAPRPRRGMSWRPLAAAAACVACIAIGVVAGRTIGRPESAGPATADSSARVVSFVLVAPGAARVSLVGDFNAWNAHATPMRTSDDGRTWLVKLPLAPGRHAYAFVVDGDVVADPAAPRTGGDDFGVPSSVVLVSRPSA